MSIQQLFRKILLGYFSVLILLINGCGGSSTSSPNVNITPADLMGGVKQGKALLLNGSVSVFAGRSLYMPDGAGATAMFNNPNGITTDGTNLYVADTNNGTIRKVVISTGEVTTLAGSTGEQSFADGIGTAARFFFPKGITTDGTNLYVADTTRIRKVVIATGEVTTLVSFSLPSIITRITNDGKNLYVLDYGIIRKVVIATGEVSVLAGNDSRWPAEGTGPAAPFSSPSSLNTDGTNLYVTDSYNNTIYKVVIATGEVSTLAGISGIGSLASFSNLQGIATDGLNLYVSDNNSIRKIVISTGNVTTLAGSAGVQGATDGTGLAARFSGPRDITTDGTNLYVTDVNNNTIRKVVIATGTVTTLAGGSKSRGSTDGARSSALFRYPYGITTDETSLYVTDINTIRKVVIATGEVATLNAQGGADETGAALPFTDLAGITTDGTNLFVSDAYYNIIFKVEIATGKVTTLAGSTGSLKIDYSTGTGSFSGGSTDGTGTAALFKSPQSITTDGTNLYVADTNNGTIRKVVISTGEVTTLAGIAGAQGSTDGTGPAARFLFPGGITTDGTSLYVADTYNYTIRQIEINTGKVVTLAGNAGLQGTIDGTGTAARFSGPCGITTDGTNLYVTDINNNTIRKVVIASGEVTTLARETGSSLSASLYRPAGVTTDGKRLFVTNSFANTLLSIE